MPSPAVVDDLTGLLNISANLRDELKRINIKSFVDIRRAGGLANLNLPGADPDTIKRLDAHAYLEPLIADVQARTEVIAKGFTRPWEIAGKPYQQFIQAVTPDLSQMEASRIHAVATAQTAYLNNMLTAFRTESGPPSPSPQANGADDADQPCDCRDCESATSEAAYLVDLLRYLTSTSATQTDTSQITVDDLADRYYQPFGNLPASCDADRTQVHQVRIAVEVLRRYLKDHLLGWSRWKSLGGDATRIKLSPAGEETTEITRPAAILYSNDRAHLFAISRDKVLYHSWEDDKGWQRWMSVGLEGAFQGEPFALLAGGLARVFIRDEQNTAWYVSELLNSPWWSPRVKLIDDAQSNVAVALRADGTLHAFVTNSDKLLWHSWQDAVDGPWKDAKYVGDANGNQVLIAGHPTAWTDRNRQATVFVRDTQNHIWMLEEEPGPSFWKWTQIGAETFAAGEVSAVLNENGTWHLFVRGNDNYVYHNLQQTPGGAWGPWQAISGIQTDGNPVAVLDSGDLSKVFVRTKDGTLRCTSQLPAEPWWSSWQSLDGDLGNDPILCRKSDEHWRLFAPWSDGTVEERQELTGPPAPPSATDPAEQQYREDAYASLLTQIGTSYDELLLARSDKAAQQSLADRLGVDVSMVGSPSNNNQPTLLLDPTTISEEQLEQVFGLWRTSDVDQGGNIIGTKDPYWDGVDLTRSEESLLASPLDGIVWGKNVSPEGYLYPSITQSGAAQGYVLKLYTDPDLTHEVMEGRVSGKGQLARMTEINRSGLSGLFYLKNYDPRQVTKQIRVMSVLEAKRLTYVEKVWQGQDFPNDQPPDDVIIDPDLMSPLDLRNAIQGNVAFDLWKKRRTWVDAQLENLQKIPHDANAVTNLFAVMAQPTTYEKTVTPWDSNNGAPPRNNFGTLANVLYEGASPDQYQQAKQAVEGLLHLTLDSFQRLMALTKAIEEAFANPLNKSVTEDQWQELYSILVQAQKAAFYPDWSKEETDRNVLFGPKDFWIALDEPGIGAWPPPRLFLDPELLPQTRLRNPVKGDPAYDLWKKRQGELEGYRQGLEQARGAGGAAGFNAMFGKALGDPATGSLPNNVDLDQVRKQLQGTDAEKLQARTTISQELHMNEAQFLELMALKDKSESPYPPTDEEWASAVSILVTAEKLKRSYATWEQEEATLVYWESLTPLLPLWRADVIRRQAWQDALKIRMQPPLIDPDLLEASYIDPIAGNPAWDIWNKRQADIQQYLPKVNTINDAQKFKAQLDSLGIKLDVIAADQDAGKNIDKRLDQAGLSADAFQFLLRIQKILSSQQTPLTSEWDDVASIFCQLQKQRQYARWRDDEQKVGIVLSPRYFRLPPVSPIEYPHKEAPPPPQWRRTLSERLDWLDQLSSRIDEQQSIRQALQEAVSQTEEQVLPPLRDSLIYQAYGEGNLRQKADALTKTLFIDMQTGGCQTITRVRQAINTLQLLLFSERLQGQRYDFDPAQWLGAYDVWQAGQLAYLYPENNLLPQLRKWQTPAFQDLIQNGRALTIGPESARDLAQSYSEYFRDVCSLRVEASCYTGISNRRLYLFGTAPSQKVYWSRIDLTDTSGYPQTFWTEISEVQKVLTVIGATSYRGTVYLFLKTFGVNAEQLTLVTFDLNDADGLITAMPQELPLALPTVSSTTTFEAVLMQYDREDDPPYLVVQRPNTGAFARLLQPGMANWDLGFPWQLIVPPEKQGQLLGLVKANGPLYLFTAADQTVSCWKITSGGAVFAVFALQSVPSFSWIGALSWPKGQQTPTDAAYAAWSSNDGTIGTIVQVAFGDELSIGVKPDPILYYSLPAQYQFERVEGYVPSSAGADTIEVFRLYDSSDNIDFAYITGKRKGQFQYEFQYENLPADKYIRDGWGTYDPQPDDSATAARPKIFLLGTSVFYAYSVASPERIPLFRFFDTKTNRTFYTTDQAEKQSAEAEQYNRLDDWYLATAPGPGLVPLYRLSHQRGDGRTVYFYTTDEAEKERALREPWNGWAIKTGFSDDDGNTHQTIVGQSTETLVPYTANVTAARWELTTRRGSIVQKTGRLSFDARSPVCPIVSQRLPITERLTTKDLQDRRDVIRATFAENAGSWKCQLEYIAEAYYFIPLYLALQLQQSADYESALDWLRSVYDWNESIDQRKIYYGLKLEEDLSPLIDTTVAWWKDELNPHTLASTRANTYTRYTICVIVRCLLDFADAEFVRGTPDSVNRAAELYRTALDLLTAPEIVQSDDCNQPLALKTDKTDLQPFIPDLQRRLARLRNGATLKRVSRAITEILKRNEPAQQRYQEACTAIEQAAQGLRPTLSAAGSLRSDATTLPKRYTTLLTMDSMSEALSALTQRLDIGNGTVLKRFAWPTPSYPFCITRNPTASQLRLHASLNLYKIETCRNYAGMPIQAEAYAQPIDGRTIPTIGGNNNLPLPATMSLLPSPYRYSTLIERAKQLVAHAQQIEGAFLATLEKRDAEAYNQLKARQDLQLANANEAVQAARVHQAQDGVTIATLQEQKSQQQIDYYNDLLTKPNKSEQDMLATLRDVRRYRQLSAFSQTIGSL